MLGTSHQVRLRHGGRTFTETMACLDKESAPQGVRPVPPAQDLDTPAPFLASYLFRSRTQNLSPKELQETVAGLVRLLGSYTRSLVAVFGEQDTAVTALAWSVDEETGDLHWYSWHAYPEHGQLVETRSTVRVDRAATGLPGNAPNEAMRFPFLSALAGAPELHGPGWPVEPVATASRRPATRQEATPEAREDPAPGPGRGKRWLRRILLVVVLFVVGFVLLRACTGGDCREEFQQNYQDRYGTDATSAQVDEACPSSQSGGGGGWWFVNNSSSSGSGFRGGSFGTGK